MNLSLRWIGTAVLLLTALNVLCQPHKIVCIGASITAGARLKDPQRESFPGQLQTMLGKDYVVSNFGVSGTTLLSHGDHPYILTKEFRLALAAEPDIVFIDLGGNDSKLINRVYANEFEKDYDRLIASFTALASHPRIILLLPIASFVTDTTGIWDPAIQKKIIPHIQQVAYDHHLEVLDMHSLFVDQQEHMPDQIHPDVQGAAIMAQRLYNTVVQKEDADFNISKAINEATPTSFFGYQCFDFKFDDHTAKIVVPQRPAPGHPWIWRARFWGHEPQTEIALLERGYHVVYCDVAELYGNKTSVARWNAFYAFLCKKGFSKKVVLEGMSRGAVYVYNWAAENPTKVACVYVDNPVLDLKSWPGRVKDDGKSGTQEWETFKRDYRLTSDRDVTNFKGSPIDKTSKIVKGHYPMLHVCGDADEDVLMTENTITFEQKIKSLGGEITVIHKPGFKHHPHSLPNPTPIVDFILNASSALQK